MPLASSLPIILPVQKVVKNKPSVWSCFFLRLIKLWDVFNQVNRKVMKIEFACEENIGTMGYMKNLKTNISFGEIPKKQAFAEYRPD